VGNNQVIQVPIGTFRVPLDKRSLKHLADQFLEAHDQLEDKIDLKLPDSKIVLPGQ
jgi:hypothetical protein